MPDNPLWMFRPFLSPAPLPLEVISQLQEPMKALQMWLFFSLLLVGAIFDCQKRLIDPKYNLCPDYHSGAAGLSSGPVDGPAGGLASVGCGYA